MCSLQEGKKKIHKASLKMKFKKGEEEEKKPKQPNFGQPGKNKVFI